MRFEERHGVLGNSFLTEINVLMCSRDENLSTDLVSSAWCSGDKCREQGPGATKIMSWSPSVNSLSCPEPLCTRTCIHDLSMTKKPLSRAVEQLSRGQGTPKEEEMRGIHRVKV